MQQPCHNRCPQTWEPIGGNSGSHSRAQNNGLEACPAPRTTQLPIAALTKGDPRKRTFSKQWKNLRNSKLKKTWRKRRVKPARSSSGAVLRGRALRAIGDADCTQGSHELGD